LHRIKTDRNIKGILHSICIMVIPCQTNQYSTPL